MTRPDGPVRRLLRRLARFSGSDRWPLPERFALAGGAFAAPDVEILDAPPGGPVLVLAPHPDDEVIGMGGALARSLDGGSEVTVAYLTDGGGPAGDREALVSRRRREAEAVGSMTGIEQVFWSHHDTRLDPGTALEELVELLGSTRPEVVYLPSFFEHHVDHYAANSLLAGALARVDLAPRVFGYEVWDTLPRPDRVLDISDVLERKTAMMRLYATPLEYTDFEALIRHRAALHYLLYVDSRRRRPPGAAEAFCTFSSEQFRRRFAGWDAELRSRDVDRGDPRPAGR